ncbi:hypothetical protein WMF30_01775 [Sorangium sp. So ce134]
MSLSGREVQRNAGSRSNQPSVESQRASKASHARGLGGSGAPFGSASAARTSGESGRKSCSCVGQAPPAATRTPSADQPACLTFAISSSTSAAPCGPGSSSASRKRRSSRTFAKSASARSAVRRASRPS